MHYIRFLKPPKTIRAGAPSINAKITITTDLGDSFLAADITLHVELVTPAGISLGTRDYDWRGRNGMRALEVAASLPKRQVGEVMMFISPKNRKLGMNRFEDVLVEEASDSAGGVVAVKSTLINSDQPNSIAGMLAARTFAYDLGTQEEGPDGKTQSIIWEETGESIARHIWYVGSHKYVLCHLLFTNLYRDAGLVLSACISSTFQARAGPTTSSHTLPFIKSLLQLSSSKILELGAGCGIVVLTLSHFLPRSKMILTDLAEASEILNVNIQTAYPASEDRVTHQVLDWSLPLPQNVEITKWDLVLVADCTYNSDVVPDLVKTLKTLAEGNGETGLKVVLAMKVRHDSELVFFDLMENAGFAVEEKMYVPLPVLEGEDQEIEIFEFGYRG
jgi:hypothetical protein